MNRTTGQRGILWSISLVNGCCVDARRAVPGRPPSAAARCRRGGAQRSRLDPMNRSIRQCNDLFDLTFRLSCRTGQQVGAPLRRVLVTTLGYSYRPVSRRPRGTPLQALMEMAPLAFGWDPRAGIGAPSDVPAVDLAVAQLDGRRGPGYANRLQHADDLGPPSHNLTVRLHPVQVRMQQRLERAPITLDDRGMCA